MKRETIMNKNISFGIINIEETHYFKRYCNAVQIIL